MSREISMDLPEDAAGPSERYYPGEENLEEMLAHSIARDFNGRKHASAFAFYDLSDRVQGRIAAAESFDAQVFLNLVLSEVDGIDDSGRPNIEYLIPPTVQALYGQGYNGLTVDYRQVRSSSHFFLDVARGLHGKEEEPLRITYHLPKGSSVLSRPGWLSSYVEMDIYGTCEELARGAKHSTFYVHDIVRQMGVSGIEDCTFYLAGVQEVEVADWYQMSSADHAFTFTFADDRKETLTTTKEFFSSHNFIWIPDGQDGWREVRPDEP